MNKTVKIKEGIFYIDGKPRFLMSGDYPYYRDDPKNWDDRLKKIKDAGIDVVTFYIPWRHHMLKQGDEYIVDFEGKTKPNRDVKLFLRLCAKNKLWTVVKPGPYIHAELNFGGLPDWVSPDNDPEIEPFLDSYDRRKPEPFFIYRGDPNNRPKSLPAPLSSKFKARVQDWHSRVYSEIIKGNLYPKGNIIAIQICNEGLYSNAPESITGYDYSGSSLSGFRKFIKKKNLKVPRALSEINSKRDLKPYLDWGKWQSEYMSLIYTEFSSVIKAKVPFVINLNPPYEEKNGLDVWLARNIPERWATVHYGFTNWLAPVSEDTSSFDRYSLLAKRRRGINFEENWGFSQIYDSRFQYPVICVFETLLAIANGSTGFNVYTAAATASWDDQIDDKHPKPYPDSSPIKEDGSLTKKYEVLGLLTAFFKHNSADLIESISNSDTAWGFYPPYAYLAAWGIPPEAWQKLGVDQIICGNGGLDRFQRMFRDNNLDFQILNIESATPSELKRVKNVILHGGFFMDRKTQRKLSAYVHSGGRLIFIKTIPLYDEDFKKFNILSDKAICIPSLEEVLPLVADPDRRLKVNDPAVQVWVYENPKKDIKFFFVLNLSDISGIKEFLFSATTVKIALPGKSAAVFKIKNSRLESAFVKGINEMQQSSVTPFVSFADERLDAETACDLFAFKKGNKWQVKVVK